MKGDNLQGLVEFVAQSLVDQPTEVNVEKQARQFCEFGIAMLLNQTWAG